MKFTDLFPSPSSALDVIKAPFEKRDGMPWLQSTARNLGHASFGDKIGDAVDQNFLGDPAPGQLGPVSGSAGTVQPAASMMAAQAPAAVNLQQMIQQLMQRKMS